MHHFRSLLAFLCAVLILLSTTAALADLKPLPLDQKKHGVVPFKSGWLSENEYQDESIHVELTSYSMWPEYSNGRVGGHVAVVTIKDPSQLRTAMSQDDYDDERQDRPLDMAKKANAVVSCNADFMKYYYGIGYIVRQGEFYRDALDGTRDVLVIDEEGNFTSVENATHDTMKAHLDEMEKDGHSPVNTFSFGPVLVRDGVPRDESELRASPQKMEAHLTAQRIAIVQLDTLTYAIVMVEGGDGRGMRLMEFSKWIAELFPECKLAYNLDGGNSVHLMVYDTAMNRVRVVHNQVGSRPISDIIYFASIATEEP
ncbi:MAG: phosphodiester glycosidase family protein [Clostridia bacterium]|nr:phosphodiester glycosidase family protein [Clostridia bacterium]